MEQTNEKKSRAGHRHSKFQMIKLEDIPSVCVRLNLSEHMHYYVSPYGDIYSHNLKRNILCRLHPQPTYFLDYRIHSDSIIKKRSYLHVHLIVGDSYKNFLVHRLVALCFCMNDDPAHKTQVDHIDGNQENNDYRNLEWVTPEENFRRRRIKRGWKQLPATMKEYKRKLFEKSKNAHKVRIRRAQESNLFNN